MISLDQLWIAIALSAVAVFLASSLIHMVLKWHNSDYLKLANEALAKSEVLAQKLPRAGAYDFDRYCCVLLRKALDETSALAVDHALD